MTEIYYESRQVRIYIVTAVLLVIATVGVALRLSARKISSARFWWDDYTIVVALVFPLLWAYPFGLARILRKATDILLWPHSHVLASSSHRGQRTP